MEINYSTPEWGVLLVDQGGSQIPGFEASLPPEAKILAILRCLLNDINCEKQAFRKVLALEKVKFFACGAETVKGSVT